MSKEENRPVIVWFHDDLRLRDQPALAAAASTGKAVLCIYVFDEQSPNIRRLGGASRWWLHHSLNALSMALNGIGARLDILRGPAAEIVPLLTRAGAASTVYWTHRYSAAEIEVDRQIMTELVESGVHCETSNGRLLHEPGTIKTRAGEFFRVFTPFWRAAGALEVPSPKRGPLRLTAAAWSKKLPTRLSLDDLSLLPVKPDWAEGLRREWRPGERGARSRLRKFLESGLRGYAQLRDRLDRDNTSHLSPHLRFGEISARQVFHAARQAGIAGDAAWGDVEKFLAELGWREFSYHLLFHFPQLAAKNFQARFDGFPWRTAEKSELGAWRRGLTGYPVVDAGMRELWETGTMHNRARMICASFLIKDLLVDWRVGEEWFWDTLCDADPANNPANWQWVAGSGADAAPYFRVFNPVLQGEKFDPAGDYVRRFVPELAKLPSRWIHRPWEAPPAVLKAAGVGLPADYPLPIVDHSTARERALAALRFIKRAS